MSHVHGGLYGFQSVSGNFEVPLAVIQFPLHHKGLWQQTYVHTPAGCFS